MTTTLIGIYIPLFIISFFLNWKAIKITGRTLFWLDIAFATVISIVPPTGIITALFVITIDFVSTKQLKIKWK